MVRLGRFFPKFSRKSGAVGFLLCFSKDCIVRLNRQLVLVDLGLRVLENFEMLACKDYESKEGASHEARQP
jgi:hypothetical protein